MGYQWSTWGEAQERAYQARRQERQNHERQMAAKREYEQDLRDRIARLTAALAQFVGQEKAREIAGEDA